MLCRTLGCSLIAVVVSATSLTAEDAASPAGDGLNAAVQEYLQLAADGKWEQADAMLEELANEHPDAPAVQLMREHAELRRADARSADGEYPESWDELSERRKARLSQSDDPQGHLKEVLEQRIDVDLADVSLTQAIQELFRDRHIDVSIELPEAADGKARPERMVVLKASQVSLSTALERILEPFQLAYTVKGRAIHIAGRDRIAGPFTTRVYAVADLVRSFPQPLVDGSLDPPPLFAPEEDLERLSAVLTATVDADGWAPNGGRGAIQGHPETLSLIIRQSESVHTEIGELFQALRADLDLSVKHVVYVMELPTAEAAELGLGGLKDPIVVSVCDKEGWWLQTGLANRPPREAATVQCVVNNGQSVSLTPEMTMLPYSALPYPILLSSSVSEDRRGVRLTVSSPRCVNAADIMATAQTAVVPDGGLAAFALKDGFVADRASSTVRVCVISSRVLVEEEEEELLGIPVP